MKRIMSLLIICSLFISLLVNNTNVSAATSAVNTIEIESFNYQDNVLYDEYEITAASAIRVLVIAITGAIIRATVSKVASRNILKIGVRSYSPAATSVVVNALKNYKSLTYTAGNKSFKMLKTDMQHILTRHHPNYWAGKVTAKQSFFHQHTKIDEIKKIASEVLKQNRNALSKKGTAETFQIKGTVNGVKYRLGITKGHVRQLYPEE